jgi:arylsulfatase A-like enzyme
MQYVAENGLRMLRNPKLNLVLLHYPTPHPPGIWDASKHVFTADAGNYIDNLQLADDTLGSIRRELEKTGEWDRSTVLVSGDHPYRQSWQTFDAGNFNSDEVMRITGGHQQPYVPFLVKLPFQREHLIYSRELNSVVTGDLILESLQGRLTSPDDMVRWLDDHTATAESGKTAFRTTGDALNNESADLAIHK